MNIFVSVNQLNIHHQSLPFSLPPFPGVTGQLTRLTDTERAWLDAILLLQTNLLLERTQYGNAMEEKCRAEKEENVLLRQENIALKKQLEEMLAKVEEGMKNGWQLEEFKRMLFGSRSERYTDYSSDLNGKVEQPTLGEVFDAQDVEGVITASRARVAAEGELAQQQTREKPNRHQKRHHVNRGKRRRTTDKLEMITTEVDYSGDKTGLKPCGKKIVITYDFQPGKIIKVATHYLKYINEAGNIVKEPVAPRIIERGTVSNRLVAQFHTEKFVYHVPYYRQLQKLLRMGISFAPSTVSGWEEICYKKLKRLVKLLRKIVHQQDYLQMDEVFLNYVNDVGKGKCSKGYFWVTNAPGKKMVLFEFNRSRGAHVPEDLLQDFSGKLQTDGLASYKSAFKNNKCVELLTCLVHIRREFYKALRNNKAMAEYFLNETRIIYDIEKHCDQHQFTPAQRAVVRQQHLKPILENLKGWLKEHQPNFPPDSPIGKAFTYAANHWHMLFKLCDDGRILPDNNEIERVLRPVTLYRKNSLFAGNEHGAERAALFFTLVENCKLHNIDPFEYLCDVYDRIYDCPASELEELLPHKWVKKEQPEA